MARAARDGVHRRNQHSFTMARSALLLTSFIITLDSMIYRITNFSLAGERGKMSDQRLGLRAAREPNSSSRQLVAGGGEEG